MEKCIKIRRFSHAHSQNLVYKINLSMRRIAVYPKYINTIWTQISSLPCVNYSIFIPMTKYLGGLKGRRIDFGFWFQKHLQRTEGVGERKSTLQGPMSRKRGYTEGSGYHTIPKDKACVLVPQSGSTPSLWSPLNNAIMFWIHQELVQAVSHSPEDPTISEMSLLASPGVLC